MADVNILTGKPIQMDRRELKAEAERKVIYEGMAMADACKSDNGQMIIKSIETRLTTRINTLMLNDAECQAYVKILAEIGIVIDRGQATAQKMVKEAIKT